MLNKLIKPMLLQPTTELLKGDNWLYQVKYDGIRMLMHYDQGKILLQTRHLTECTSRFPEITQNIRLNAKNAIIDSELISLDEKAMPDWEQAMIRFNTKKEEQIQHLTRSKPCILMAFDLLYLDGVSLLSEPLEKRLELLSEVVEPSDAIAVVESHTDGETLLEATKQLQLEGVTLKRTNSIYTLDARPQNTWLKFKNYLYEEVEIAGIRRDPFGWILTQDNGKTYKGVCEFVPPNERRAVANIARRIIRKEEKDMWYLDPVLKCQVKSQGYTKKGNLLRTPSFVKFVFN